jgi:hypothetical protein
VIILKILCPAIILLIVFVIIISPLKTTTYTTTFDKPVVGYPDENTAYTINGYKDVSNSSDPSTNSSDQSTSSVNSESSYNEYKGKYLGNKNTKKYHITTCHYIKKTREENVVIFETIDDANKEGYKSCSVCIK